MYTTLSIVFRNIKYSYCLKCSAHLDGRMKKRLIRINIFVLISLLYAACGRNVPATPGIGSTIISDKDGAKMV